MEILLLGIYASLCLLVFRLLKIPVNKWSVTTAILGGAVMLFMILSLMNYNHPFTSNGRVYFVSTPVITEVNGLVDSVYVVQGGQEVHQGDTLFTIRKDVYRSRVLDLEAQIKLAKIRLAESAELASLRAGSKYDVETYTYQIEQLQAELIAARYKLRACVITSSIDGYVAQNRLQPGMRVVEFPLRPVMTVVDNTNRYIVGAFPQNPLQRVKTGENAEVIFDAIPGRVFHGKVGEPGAYIAQGELQAFGTLYDFDLTKIQGSVPVVIELSEGIEDYYVPGGAKTQIAIYTEHWEAFSILRKILLRMKGWMHYIYGEH